jgi:hypothetical protein
MPFTGIVYPQQLRVLTEALQSHCSEFNIEPDSPAYYEAGRLAIILFESGMATPEELAAALRDSAKNELPPVLKTARRSG